MGKGNAGAGELEAHDLLEQQQDNNSSSNGKGNSNSNCFWSSREDEEKEGDSGCLLEGKKVHQGQQ